MPVGGVYAWARDRESCRVAAEVSLLAFGYPESECVDEVVFEERD
jgi:hypothetical protein